jgi:hypothetical protein
MACSNQRAFATQLEAGTALLLDGGGTMAKPGGRPKSTHCKHGHEYTPANTSVVAHGRYAGERRCRACIANDKAKAKAKAAEERAKRKESWFF